MIRQENMALLGTSKETIDAVRSKAGLTEDRTKEAVKALKEWLELQPHLPHDYDEARVESLFLRCKASVERCKEVIDMYYTVRSAIPEIFCNRDPEESWFQLASSVRCCIPLPRLTEDFNRVRLIACLDQDPSKYNVYDMHKMIYMVTEIRTMEDYCFGDVYIIDFNNLTMAHVVKYSLPVLKKLEIASMKAFKARIRGIHFINVAPFVDSTIHLFKSLLKPKISARVHVHRKNSTTLLDHISPKILPSEYGGEADSIHVLWDLWKKKIHSYREWFLSQENSKVDESRRPGKAFDSSELFGFEGSFRQLAVD
ncbi:alpha-tocopherol transfer protein-like [Periplaneta americana]|uniref:alpha-tocopherol transfer protein-like n=1 Tax=Periplaneta americana TaxID=6978 RepID=UPI0037E8DCB7